MVSETEPRSTIGRRFRPMPDYLQEDGPIPSTWTGHPDDWRELTRLARSLWLGRRALEITGRIAGGEFVDEVLTGRRRPHPGELCQLSDDLVRRAREAQAGLRARLLSLDTLSQHYLELAALPSADVTVAQALSACDEAGRLCRSHDYQQAAGAKAEMAKLDVIVGPLRQGMVLPGQLAPGRHRLGPDKVEELRDWWVKYQGTTRGQLPPCPFEILEP